MKVIIRSLKEDGLTEIQTLYKVVNVELGTNDLFLDDVIKSQLSDFAKIVNTNSQCFVAEVEGQIVGMIICRSSTCMCEDNKEFVELERLAVASQMRRIGIGGKLIDAVSMVAKQSNSRLHLTMISGNSNAEKFYEAIGFQKTLTEPRVSLRNGDKYTLIHYCK